MNRAALDAALAAVLGHKLFTVLLRHPVTPWNRRLFHDGRPFLGRTAGDIRANFPDHAVIAMLGCGSVLNLPVLWNGRALGALNLLHEEDWYDDADVPIGLAFAALAVPAYLAAAGSRPS